jgi:hypothetical protein
LAHIYGKRFDGKVFEIQNWGRSRTGDALVMQPLSNSQTNVLKRLRAKGCSDSQIWGQLHPGQPRPDRPLPSTRKATELKVELATLDKEQLVWLIENMMDTPLESLDRMSHTDLVKLASHVGGGAKIRISFAA